MILASRKMLAVLALLGKKTPSILINSAPVWGGVYSIPQNPSSNILPATLRASRATRSLAMVCSDAFYYYRLLRFGD